MPAIPCFSTPTAPINNSLAWLVSTFPVLTLPLPVSPDALLVTSRGLTETKPETDNALAALTTTEPGKLTVIVSLVVKAVLTGAEKIRILIAAGVTSVISTSRVYAFDLLSVTLTV